MAEGGDWEIHLRTLSSSARDSNFSNDPASDSSLLHSVRKLIQLCKSENSENLIARVYPQLNKIFQRSVSSISQSRSSSGLLLLAILQYFIDYGEFVLHDADPSLRTFFRSCLSREFADPVVAEATLDFLNLNKRKILLTFPTLLPQFYPLMLKLIAWNGEKLEKPFLKVFPGLMSPGSFLPLFISLVDLPVLTVALEKVEKSSGPLIGSSIATIQKSAAPEMLLALMDEAYTGSTIGDGGADSESEESNSITSDPLFLELLKDENDGLAQRHWTSPGMEAALQAATSVPSDRLKQALKMAPRLLDVYFSIALHDVNQSLKCALIPMLLDRNSKLFPDKIFSYEVRKRLLNFMLAAFHQSPEFVAILKKPVVDRLGEAYDSPEKTELALQLCWAIGEHGGGGASHKDAARELFESLELLLYENLSSSRLGVGDSVLGSSSSTVRRSSQSRLLCFVVTAIAKIATHHRELLPRARVSLGKVAHSRISDARVWKRARDYLGLMNEPAICLSVLGPSGPSSGSIQKPGTINWSEGKTKIIANIPFYILGGQEGPPHHDFSLMDILPASFTSQINPTTMVSAAKIKSIDFFRKTPRDLTEASLSGAGISAIAAIIIIFLFGMELHSYLTISTSTAIIIDKSSIEDTVRIDFNISFPFLSCEFASVDNRLNITKTIRKYPINRHLQTKGHEFNSGPITHTPKHDEKVDETYGEGSVALNSHNFDKITHEHQIVVVNFWAPWCHWSRLLRPSWEKAAKVMRQRYSPEHDGRLIVGNVDCTKEADLCQKHHIQGYPTIRIYRKSIDVHDDLGIPVHESYYGDRDTDTLVMKLDDLVSSIGTDSVKRSTGRTLDYTKGRTAPLQEGCRIEGFVWVKKVPGNMIISAFSGSHSFDASRMNMSHVISTLSFGSKITPMMMSDMKRLGPYIGVGHNRLNGQAYMTSLEDRANVTIEHYLQVVKTEVSGLSHNMIENYEYTAHTSLIHSHSIPAAKFHLEFSPMQVLISENSKPFSHFITNLCAIIGGVFTVAGILDSILYNTCKLARKIDLGKNY
ncbi:hypothetical protein SSX86_006809 [Deinandra increscens subsp. villosa]|uniref:Thioredoxin domain-containing protein n=1 Tax=Deinandra increscens subsp. villosa TaxID=3103831 RepID=A0AAP0DK89_9ASTR